MKKQSRNQLNLKRSNGRFLFRMFAVLNPMLLVCVLSIQFGCIPRPLDLQMTDSKQHQPVEGVTIHRHSVTLLSLLASSSNSVKSDPAGEARMWIPPFNTKLTFLEPGFEPASIAIFSSRTASNMFTPEHSSQMVLRFEELDGKTKRSIVLSPVKYVDIHVKVVDDKTRESIEGAEVLASTFLYLPMPGLEDRWGLPDLQNKRSDAAGRSSIQHASGFRNVVTARKPGYQGARMEFLANDVDTEIVLGLRRLETKSVSFKILDSQSKQEISDAVVTMDEPRNGLPPDPNGFAVFSDATGTTPSVRLPNLMPLVIESTRVGYHRYSKSLDWPTLKDGEVVKIPLKKRGWFD